MLFLGGDVSAAWAVNLTFSREIEIESITDPSGNSVPFAPVSGSISRTGG